MGFALSWIIPFFYNIWINPGPRFLDTEVSFYRYEDVDTPDSLDTEGGRLYVWDSGRVHELGATYANEYDVGINSADVLHIWKGDIYLLTAPQSVGEERYFTILRVRGADVREMMEQPFYAGSGVTEIRLTDFALSNNGGILWLTLQDLRSGNVSLHRMNYDSGKDCFVNLEWFADLQANVTDENQPRLVVDNHDNLYISAPEDHAILRLKLGEQSWEVFVGKETNGQYNDGSHPTFMRPMSIASEGEYLYVYDNGAVRRVSLKNGESWTMAGKALNNHEGRPSSVPKDASNPVSGQEAVLPCGDYPGLAVGDDGSVFLCNRYEGVIYRITERKGS